MSNLFGSSLGGSIISFDANLVRRRQAYPAVTLQGQPNVGRLQLDTAPQPRENVPNREENLELSAAPIAMAAGANTTADALALPGATFDASAISAARNLVLPDATDLVAALGESYVGTSLEFHVIGAPATYAATVVAGAGGTTLGAMAVAAASSGHFRVRLTSLTAYEVTRLA